MEDISVFTDKSQTLKNIELEEKLGETYSLWQELHDFVNQKVPNAINEWNFPGKKYGWSFRIKDKRRAVIYFLPREGYFKAAFVFGQKRMMILCKAIFPQRSKINFNRPGNMLRVGE